MRKSKLTFKAQTIQPLTFAKLADVRGGGDPGAVTAAVVQLAAIPGVRNSNSDGVSCVC